MFINVSIFMALHEFNPYSRAKPIFTKDYLFYLLNN